MLGSLLLIITIIWSQSVRLQYSGFMDLAHIGHTLFTSFANIQIIAVAVLMPALAAPVIAAEKDRRTLHLLLMSNLSNGNILLDKLLSRIVLLGLLLLSGLPIFLALLAFGGIEPAFVLNSYAWMFGIMFACGGIGLFYSTRLNKTHTAMMATYATMVVYFFAIIFLREERIIPWRTQKYFLPVRLDENSGFFFLCGGLTVFLLSLTICRRMLPHVAGRRKRHILKRLFGRLNAFFERINFTGIVMWSEEKALSNNAAMWKESSKHFFASTTFLVRLSYTLLVLTMILLLVPGLWGISGEVVCLIGFIVLAMITIIASSAAFTSEREKHSFEVLMSSPLTAGSIVWAKFISILKLTIPVLLCMVSWLIIGGAVDGEIFDDWYWRRATSPNAYVVITTTMLAYFPMFIAIGLYSSVKRKKVQTAMLQTFLIILTWSLLPVVLLLLEVFDVVNLGDFNEGLMQMTPVLAGAFVLDGNFETWAYLWWIPAWMILLYIIVRRFDKLVGRQ